MRKFIHLSLTDRPGYHTSRPKLHLISINPQLEISSTHVKPQYQQQNTFPFLCWLNISCSQPYTHLKGGSQRHRRSRRCTSWSAWLHLFIFSIQWDSISSSLDVTLDGGVCTGTLPPKTTFWLRNVDCYHFSNSDFVDVKLPRECCLMLWFVCPF
jgi:hypothetical protein